MKATAADLDDYDHEFLTQVPSSKILVFIISTFGEGDPTDNSYRFCTTLAALHDGGNKETLHQLQYAAFGLGNRNYKHYNRIIDIVDETFQSLGAHRLLTVGRADEAKGGMSTDEDFMEWKESALECISQKFGVEATTVVYKPALVIVPTEADQNQLHLGEQPAHHLNGRTKKDSHRPVAAPIVAVRDLATSDHLRQCIHLEVDLTGARIKYQTGDHLAVWPVNCDDEVERLCRLLSLSEADRTAAVEIRPKETAPLPTPTTRETILRHYLEISGPVSRDLLGLLVNYCPTPEASRVLTTLYKNKEAFKNHVSSHCLTVGKVMEMAGGLDALWDKVPFSLLVETLGKLQPRFYSIASSPSISPNQPAITVSTTSKILGSDCRFYGVASNYLLAAAKRGHKPDDKEAPRYKLSSSGKVLVQLRRSTFKLPASATRPIIMVGAGTGIAPFRAFVQERAAMAARGLTVGQMVLLFGCRSPSEDFLYGDEWAKYQAQLPDFRVEPVFSRYPNGREKVYVQDRLMEMKELVAELLEQGAAFYICGSADMARNVRGNLVQILAEFKSWDETQAESYIMGYMKRARLLQEDVWSN